MRQVSCVQKRFRVVFALERSEWARVLVGAASLLWAELLPNTNFWIQRTSASSLIMIQYAEVGVAR